MAAYIVRRILLMIPTMFGIMLVAFVVVQFAPGGPVERVIAQLSGHRHRRDLAHFGVGRRRLRRRATRRRARRAIDAVSSKYRGAQGLDPEFIKKLEKQFGFDKPAPERFCADAVELHPLRFRQELLPRHQRAATDQGEAAGLDLARPLDDAAHLPDLDPARHQEGGRGRLAVRPVDVDASIIIGYAIPGFLFAILLIVLFAGGSFLDWFPLRGLTSDNWAQLPWYSQDPRLFLAPHAADHLHGAVGASRP